MSGKFFRTVLAVALLAIVSWTASPALAVVPAVQVAPANVLVMEHGTTGT
jgi:hypothetical protein